ncbi:MAG TPA: hypothetical protein VIJ38_03015 [Acidobacteriaceae bacterium]
MLKHGKVLAAGNPLDLRSMVATGFGGTARSRRVVEIGGPEFDRHIRLKMAKLQTEHEIVLSGR